MNRKGFRWADVDISDYEDPLWETFDINVVPTVIVFKDAEPVFRRDGTLGRGLSKEAIAETVQMMETPATH
jgi:thioredoxin-like negative regulator of GroEL